MKKKKQRTPSELCSLRSLRCHDGDGNENVKKAIGLDKQNNNNSARASRFFFVHFFTVTARLGREKALNMVVRNSAPEEFACI